MKTANGHRRLNVYVDDELRAEVKIAAARQRVSISAFCVEAIQQRLAQEARAARMPIEAAEPSTSAESMGPVEQQVDAARALDDLPRQLGPIGVSVDKLIAEGRRR